MKITLRQLSVFDAVASSGSIVLAAESLNMSASAASAALKDLQAAMKRPPLIVRAGRGLQLTREGRRIHPLVRSLLQAAGELEEPTPSASAPEVIAVGVTETGAHFLPALAASFRREHPNIRVDILVASSQEIVAKLGNFSLDLVVTDNMPREPGTHLTQLFLERTVIIAAPGNRLAESKRLEFSHLADADWCMPGRTTLMNIRLNDVIRGHIANPRVVMEINSGEGIREAVKSGIGISCLPHSLVKDDLNDGRLCELSISGFAFERPTFLVRMTNVENTIAARLFAQHLIDSLALSPPGHPAP